MDGKLLLQPGRKVSFTVEGLPKGKARPRARVIKGKNGKPAATIYTPKSTKDYESAVERVVRKTMQHPPFEGPVRVSIKICFPVAASWTKKKLADVRRGLIAHTQKPDIDNVVKAILDGMVITDANPDGSKTPVGVMKDDDQIVRLSVIKDWAEVPRVTVLVTELVVPDKLPAEEVPVTGPRPKPIREKGLAKQGGAATAEPVVNGVDDGESHNGAKASQPGTNPDSDPEVVYARAQCGFDGLAKDCPNHDIPGAKWCDGCMPKALAEKLGKKKRVPA